MKKYKFRFTIYVTLEMLKTFVGLFTIHKLHLVEKREEGEDITTFIFAPRRKFNYQAGQYGVWFIPRFILGKPARLFTIAASPTEDTLQVSTRIRTTDFKKKLNSLPIGTAIYMIGPLGVFTLDKKPSKKVVLLAGGIGITPMRSLARFVHDAKVDTTLTLIYSSSGYYLYQDELKHLIQDSHFVTRDSFAETLEKVIKASDDDTVYYLSGPPAFVVSTEKILETHGVKHSKKDGFLGY
ncbi:MAG: oxidoreductase FAD/NAD(P)-binding domain protein [Candidatus Saccharibacteria bacterium]|nr:oxidoreductase FAD/NAD(P)-binding domain protein [Candidatus Saccharibacteria bacterium]